MTLLQQSDPHISRVLKMMEHQNPPTASESKAATAQVQKLISKWSQLKLINNTLYRTMNINGELTETSLSCHNH